MIPRVRQEIELIKQSAESLLQMSEDWPSLRRNAQIIMIFARLLDFITPPLEVEHGRDTEDPHSLP
jgi:hypothetical protein